MKNRNRKAAPRVRVRQERITLPTYLPAAPDRNPMFLEKRVYQGSSGKVYPLPFIDRIAEEPVPREWQAIWIENEYLRVLVLPEIGGRIHRILDRTNGYDLIYHQPVIKPALVGLAGPWISGGIEFNWPQHHRPATFMPVDTTIERSPDGSVTVWCGDHDPMARMKGMHGVCLHPRRAYVELKVRVCNRTPLAQTFLWWANVATRVHAAYQSFFPPDVTYVADHARRSMSRYPLADARYYGVDYGARGRRGVPPQEVSARYVPPHCAPGSRVGSTYDAAEGAGFPDYAPNDLSFYANIPVPTSYMCLGSRGDFFGGYDYRAEAGIIHVANHHIAPGKKQWTWGNHDFGYAWDRNLTDADAAGEHAPYIEIMAGVYTDNQPDFSFLQPGETKSWSQHWYPIQKIGPAHQANLDAAVSLQSTPNRLRIGVSVTRELPGAEIRLERRQHHGSGGLLWKADLRPGRPFISEAPMQGSPWRKDNTSLLVSDHQGRPVIRLEPEPHAEARVPPPATEPPVPADIPGNDELFVTGLHLDQYRHATRCPTLYWREALRRDPLDARCNNALGLWHLKRGEFGTAEDHFRRAIDRLTRRNANPADGEPFYNLGLCLRYQADALVKSDLLSSAYDAFYKATWNQAWAGASFHALAELDCRRQDWRRAGEHLEQSLRFDTDNLRARDLKVVVLRKLAEAGDSPSRKSAPAARSRAGITNDLRGEAETLLRATLKLDPLDWWARQLSGEDLTCDAQTALDLALDYAGAGLYAEAIGLLKTCANRWMSVRKRRGKADPTAMAKACSSAALPVDPRDLGTEPMIHYYLGWLHSRLGDRKAAKREFGQAAASPPDYCFPSRLEEIGILETALAVNPGDARAACHLGNLFYDRRRHEEAIRLWQRSARLDPGCSIVWRNLGIGLFNIRRQAGKARAAYAHACRANPADARLLYERDQLWKRLGEKPAKRLQALEKRPELVRRRDDLSVELCALYNQTGRHAEALALVSSRHFQPWEGGEGGPLGQWVRAHLGLGRAALQGTGVLAGAQAKGERPRKGRTGGRETDRGLLVRAVAHFEKALTTPVNLGESRHLLANQSDVHYWLGCAHEALGARARARHHWQRAATFKGDFQEMSTRAFSEMTFFSALSWARLGRKARATKLLTELLAHARELQQTEARIDYFATSLPTMLLFEDDLQFRQETTALFLQAQARLGLNQKARARTLLRRVLERDPNHPMAADIAGNLGAGD
ncbi:MAG: DUF5107 domain-containing protein [Verrucomicrobiales bacterium]|nr:DUF5107 domain-containing protein [Verrucomicrobiales bacterium]